LTVATVGGCGILSIAEKRKDNAQSVKDDTFDGESDVGSFNAMFGRLRRASDSCRDECQASIEKESRIDDAMVSGSSSGPK
jgi:hypothetical protein